MPRAVAPMHGAAGAPGLEAGGQGLGRHGQFDGLVFVGGAVFPPKLSRRLAIISSV